MSTQVFQSILMGWAIASVYVALNVKITDCKNWWEKLALLAFGSPTIVLIVVTFVLPLMIKDAVCKNAPAWNRSMARPLWQWAAIAAVCCALAGTVFGLTR